MILRDTKDRLAVQAVGLFRYFTRHKTAANLLLVIMIVSGLAAIPQMRAQFFPDVVVDNISVDIRWPGAGAEDLDRGVVQLVGPALQAVDGVTNVSARSREGRASFTIDFETGWDMGRASTDVQDALDAVGTLPEDVEDPVTRRSSWGERVTNVVVTGPVAVEQLARFADEFAARLYNEGITRTTIRGVASAEVLVEVPTRNLIENDLSMADIAQAIRSTVSTDPSGETASGGARVRTGAERRTAEQVAEIALRTRADGTVLRLGDVAELREGGIDRDRAFWVGDDPAITLRVDRSERGDAIEIQARVQALADAMNRNLPEGVKFELVSTRAEFISGRIMILVKNATLGLGLVVVLLFLFLNARTAFWVSAGIPAAMLAAIAVMYLMGLSFNMISLFALIITLGIVVDDAIVVGEHADYRARELGESPAEAAENAATRMAQPVFAATITTVLAFGALILVGGRFGTLIADIPLTVIAVLVASLVECFLILPNHMYHAIASGLKERWYDWPSRQVNRGFQWVRERAFRPFISFIIAARYPVLAALIALLTVQMAHLVRGDLPFRFFNPPEQGSITGNIVMTDGATRADTLEMLRELQRATDALSSRMEEETGTSPVLFVMTELGGHAGRALASAENKDSDLLGSISIDLVDADLREVSSSAFASALQDEVQALPRLEEFSFRSWGAGPGGDSLSVDLSGGDSETLKAASEALRAALVPYPEITGLEDNLPYDKQELLLQLTAQGQALGFTVEGLSRDLRNRLSGVEAATFPDGLRTGRIRVEVPASERAADFLDSMMMRAASGSFVPLGDIVSVTERQGFSSIQRENGVRVVTVTGDLSEDDPARAREITRLLTERILPDLEADFGITTRLSGQAEQEREFLSDAVIGISLCLILIYLTLAWVFSSWLRPMVVMAVIPFGLIGVIYGHTSWNMAMSMFSIVGMMGMAGIIINDSIVLVTTVDQYARDRGLIPSIIDATCDRLRPVLLTTLTTVLGLTPLMFENSTQAAFLQPTVITLVYGLGFGMFIVLLLVPALLAIGHDMRRQVVSLRRALTLPARGISLVPLGAALVLGVWFLATIGGVFVTGEMLVPSGMAALAESPMRAAMILFMGGAVLGLVLAWCLGALGLWLGTRGGPQSERAQP
ncbi:efflux RND transporter permease subunit [Roseinatronobacter bogoriensis]|uniref:AcrB/AcrD/AcrF family protein n=1 Tax=Roseinatronobacter bogoriensis subsp. barguzinensis TaxID=441209 RepID=A0A2K8KGH0_9RHOB|nr:MULTISPECIES: efflux RND transporter permease subunit [Rhodobaca]ATX66855.1 AcrB/AcrD/AcrF family protein [Rhodobaca barguzinensis]MBB4206329.1 multidrug efflux pump subunit AcrB [Rhodobaca bogoriensis DSM 18756]TDW41074.1 multidrug efflux pump subunit AcrB [Rhodobaca barguzinensis]TDY74748.1 multidrug efflux pump subunit AcrB [Rhodobaca bogoriensis DSM 18756]